MHALRVECHTSERGGVPVCFGRGDAVQQVAEVVDRWPGEDYCYFRVRTEEGCFYVLRHDERDDSWWISVYRRSETLPQETPPHTADPVRPVHQDPH